MAGHHSFRTYTSKTSRQTTLNASNIRVWRTWTDRYSSHGFTSGRYRPVNVLIRLCDEKTWHRDARVLLSRIVPTKVCAYVPFLENRKRTRVPRPVLLFPTVRFTSVRINYSTDGEK